MVQTEQLAHSLCRVIYSFYEVYGDYEGVGQRTGGETGIRTLDMNNASIFSSLTSALVHGIHYGIHK
jgi:hypothetical protein